MNMDYADAARRHWNDAELLKQNRRSLNADQLYALAAECALKYVMAFLGASTTSRGDLDTSLRVHIDELWSEYLSYVGGRRGSRYMSPLASFDDNPFSDWHISQRYASDASPPSGSVLSRHEKASRACLVVLQRATEA